MNYFKIKTVFIICIPLLFISYNSFSQKGTKKDELIDYSWKDTVRVFDSNAYSETMSIVPMKVSYHTHPEVLPILKSCSDSKELTPDNCTQKKLNDLMSKNTKYPKDIKNILSTIVKLVYVVKEDGSVFYLRDKCQGNIFLINEAFRVFDILKETDTVKPFIPGKIGGKNVQVLMELPVIFKKD
ncbi:MAG TPA: hypothetical protein VK590_14480 [Saprospiraceae bacterium]|nr:hypothetical protein [Saprospiraceae bacterium]